MERLSLAQHTSKSTNVRDILDRQFPQKNSSIFFIYFCLQWAQLRRRKERLPTNPSIWSSWRTRSWLQTQLPPSWFMSKAIRILMWNCKLGNIQLSFSFWCLPFNQRKFEIPWIRITEIEWILFYSSSIWNHLILINARLSIAIIVPWASTYKSIQ